ncbi:SH3 domain-containing protein [Roseobacteraceae bacterium NS-SX3]
MPRYILVSFAFLGWTFYEMSGGSDFVPPAQPAPDQVAEAGTATAAPRPAETVSRSGAASVPLEVTAASLVTRPVIQPAEAAPAPGSTRPAANPNLRAQIALSRIEAAGSVIASADTVFSDEPAATVQLASATGGLAPALAAAEPEAEIPAAAPAEEAGTEPAADLRYVRGSRVNMRMGPGTAYPVIARVVSGDEVEVFEDSGTGWLRLRVVEKGRVGWIAASLISENRP